jgi:hypothetical protein
LELYVYSNQGMALIAGPSYNFLSAVLLTPLSGTVAPVTAARAYRNAALTTGVGGGAIAVDTITNDPGGNFSVATGRYTCPATGYYQVNGEVEYTNVPANGQFTAQVYKNGAVFSEGATQVNSVAGNSCGTSVSDVIFCNAGDYLQLAGWTSAAFALRIGSTWNYLSVVQVGNSMNFTAAGGDLTGTYPSPTITPQTHGAVTVSNFSYSSGAYITAWTGFTSGTYLTAAANGLTVTKAGEYLFDLRIRFDGAAGNRFAYIYNTTQNTAGNSEAGGANCNIGNGLHTMLMMHCNVGDVIQASLYMDTAAAPQTLPSAEIRGYRLGN